jgi:hypothetical protein
VRGVKLFHEEIPLPWAAVKILESSRSRNNAERLSPAEKTNTSITSPQGSALSGAKIR